MGRLVSAVLDGVEARLVTVEVHRGNGLPQTTLVGMPGTAVRESLDRIHAACSHVGLRLEPRRTTINLAPADRRKSGSGLDLPIALGLLVADGRLDPCRRQPPLCLGELGLDASVRPVPGALPAALAARRAGIEALVLPRDNVSEVADIPDVNALGVATLTEATAILESGSLPTRPAPSHDAVAPARGVAVSRRDRLPDLCDVIGHAGAKRALELAAAGSHHLLFAGPAGAGKTLLARTLPGLLPPLSFDEAVEASVVYSAVGSLTGHGLLERRPFRAPHHTITRAGLLGGGLVPRPGEVSLAHHGVLFLDELPEFRRGVLEALRQPLEEATIPLVRAGRSLQFPARFQLVAAMNPCPCGRGPDDDDCRCSEAQVAGYWRRLSGPLLDRIDIFVGVDRTPLDGIIEARPTGGPVSEKVRDRVVEARHRQRQRWKRLAAAEGLPVPSEAVNAALPPRLLRRACRLSAGLRAEARRQAEALALSARGWHRVLRLSRTIADLDAAAGIERQHLLEALQYRQTATPW